MKVFLTGGTGFIGKYVVKKLIEQDHDVLILSRRTNLDFSNTKFIKGNLSNPGSYKGKIEQFEPDSAIHLAWEGIPDYGPEMSNKNLENSLMLISNLIDIGCKKIICTGSLWEYKARQGCLNENSPVEQYNHFTKAKITLHKQSIDLTNNIIYFIWLRLFYAYGPKQKSESLIPYITRRVIEKKEPLLKTPFSKNDFIYVEDVADAIVNILNKCNKSTTYNISSGYSTSIQDIMKIIYEHFGHEYQKQTTNEKYEDYWASIDKIKKEIGWSPKTSLKDGIRITINSILNEAK